MVAFKIMVELSQSTFSASLFLIRSKFLSKLHQLSSVFSVLFCRSAVLPGGKRISGQFRDQAEVTTKNIKKNIETK